VLTGEVYYQIVAEVDECNQDDNQIVVAKIPKRWIDKLIDVCIDFSYFELCLISSLGQAKHLIKVVGYFDLPLVTSGETA